MRNSTRRLASRPARFVFGMGSGAVWVNPQSAAQHHIDTTGISLNGMLGLTIRDMFMASFSFSIASPSDHASFSETVVPCPGALSIVN